MNIGLIGYGVVGKAISQTLSKSYQIVLFDKYLGFKDFKSLIRSDYIFVSVPTPFDCKTNKIDDTAILENLELLHKEKYKGIVIIKSTLPPGSTEKYSGVFNLNMAFNPEFLRESTTPNEDFENQKIVVIGTNKEKVFDSVKKMYKKVLPPEANYFFVSSTEAEMIKYSQNTMLAGRVALANVIYDACQELGIKYEVIKNIAFDPFEIIGPHMVQVPGPDKKRGFGGKCLPKDLNGFSSVFNSALIDEIIRYNNSLRKDLDNFLLNYKNS